MEEEYNEEDVEVWDASPGGSPTPQIPQATKEDAIKALKDLYEDLKKAPKYLRPGQFAKPYNEAKSRFEHKDFAFVQRETTRIRKVLKDMKQDYHDLALKIMKVRDQIQDSQKAGIQMDYDGLLGMLDKCVNVLKLGKLEAGQRLVDKFMMSYETQLDTSLGPARDEALGKLNGINVMVQEAKAGGLDTELEEHQLGKLMDAVKLAANPSEIQEALNQTDGIVELIEFSKNEQKVNDELPKAASHRMSSARADLFELTKLRMENMDEILLKWEMAQEMFSNAASEQEFEALNKQLDALDAVMADKKAMLSQITNEKTVLSGEVEELRDRLQEMTYLGFLVASLSNRLDKIEKKLKLESTEAVLRETERMLYNLGNELDSIQEQNMDEFNLQMRLLMDFEVLSDLVEKLDEPIDNVEDFIMEFSMMFAQAPSLETYHSMNESMVLSLKLVKQALGMEIEEEEPEQDEDELPELEPVMD